MNDIIKKHTVDGADYYHHPQLECFLCDRELIDAMMTGNYNMKRINRMEHDFTEGEGECLLDKSLHGLKGKIANAVWTKEELEIMTYKVLSKEVMLFQKGLSTNVYNQDTVKAIRSALESMHDEEELEISVSFKMNAGVLRAMARVDFG